jgi:hypothetical protein
MEPLQLWVAWGNPLSIHLDMPPGLEQQPGSAQSLIIDPCDPRYKAIAGEGRSGKVNDRQQR